MKVNPIVYEICFDCSDTQSEELVYTVQYLREIQIPHSRSCWGRNKPILTYICGECGGWRAE